VLSLPAAATTTTPALTALPAATASAESLVPNAAPSDRFAASMSLSTAHSSASAIRSVVPVQPNTRTA
jgi:hypothetical protein